MFSFVIPCHNNVALLRKALAGLAANTGRIAFEVILVDNNSFADDIDEAYRDYVQRLELYLVRQPRLAHPMAVSRARNLGLDISRNRWVVNLDSDCVVMPGYVRRLARWIEDQAPGNPIGVGLRRFVDMGGVSEEAILGGVVAWDSLPLVASQANYFQVEDRRKPYLERLGQVEQPWAYFHSCNLFYRRDKALEARGFDEGFDGCWGYEDIDFAHRMITGQGAAPCYLPGIDCLHQDSELSGEQNRFHKPSNPNWHRICERIPGYREYKAREYTVLSNEIIL